jgi:hypothetical protein
MSTWGEQAKVDEYLGRVGTLHPRTTSSTIASAPCSGRWPVCFDIGRPGGDPEDRLVDIDTQLGWMDAAGMDDVDCMWRWRGFALLCGTA